MASGSIPRVSVIIPVRDRRSLLNVTLTALTRQTFDDFEVIVVDDGSTDGSADEAAAFSRMGLPVHVVAGDGSGAVGARCRGVEVARADVLAFTDSDCRPSDGWLEAGVAAIDRGADLVQGRTEPDGEVGPLDRTVSVGEEDGLYATCNLFVRRAAFDRVGGFDRHAGHRLGFRRGRYLGGLGFGEDTLLGWAVRSTGTTAFAPEALVSHHVFPMNRAELFKRAWNTGGFPALVREVPGLRTSLLRHRVVLAEPTRLPLYALPVAVLLRRRALAAALIATWVGLRTARLAGRVGSRRTLVRLLPDALAADVVTAAALGVGSVRARNVVL